jgi:hypothetical protein
MIAFQLLFNLNSYNIWSRWKADNGTMLLCVRIAVQWKRQDATNAIRLQFLRKTIPQRFALDAHRVSEQSAPNARDLSKCIASMLIIARGAS